MSNHRQYQAPERDEKDIPAKADKNSSDLEKGGVGNVLHQQDPPGSPMPQPDAAEKREEKIENKKL